VVGEAEELRIGDEPPALEPPVAGNDGPHLIEEQLAGHPAEAREGGFETGEQRPQILARGEAEPEEPGVAQDHEERIAHAPRQHEPGEVHLGLVTRRRFEAHHLLDGRGRPQPLHQHLELTQTTRVPGRPDFSEEADRREVRVVREALLEQGAIGIELTRPGRAGMVADGLRIDVALQVPGADPAVNRRAIEAEPLGDGGLAEPSLEIVAQQHMALRSVHARLRTRGGAR